MHLKLVGDLRDAGVVVQGSAPELGSVQPGVMSY